MAPSLEEPTQVDLDAPLKLAPELVAPEPGTPLNWPDNDNSDFIIQSTAQDPSRILLERAMRVKDVRTKVYVPAHRRVPIQISP